MHANCAMHAQCASNHFQCASACINENINAQGRPAPWARMHICSSAPRRCTRACMHSTSKKCTVHSQQVHLRSSKVLDFKPSDQSAMAYEYMTAITSTLRSNHDTEPGLTNAESCRPSGKSCRPAMGCRPSAESCRRWPRAAGQQ